MQNRNYNWLMTLLLALILTGCAKPQLVNGMTLPTSYDARVDIMSFVLG